VSIYDDAYALIPGGGTANTARQGFGLPLWQPTMKPAFTATAPAVRARVQAHVRRLGIEGKPVHDDIARPIIDARYADEIALERADILHSVLLDIESHEQNRFTAASIKPALAFLRGQLRNLVVEVRSLAPTMAGIRSASDVLNRNDEATTNAWQRLKQLVDRYAEIRSTQNSLYTDGWDRGALTPFTTETFDKAGLFVDALDHLRSYVEQRARSAEASRNHWTDRPRELAAFDEWLDQGSVSAAFTETEPVLQLVLACTELTPWIPEADEMQEALADAYGLTNSPDQNNLTQLLEARDRYYARVTREQAALKPSK
jgi:hypothetical protein